MSPRKRAKTENEEAKTTGIRLALKGGANSDICLFVIS